MSGPLAARLSAGRLHLQHGPIDLVIEVWAPGPSREIAETAAYERLASVLDELVPQLAVLRRTEIGSSAPSGSIARRMVDAVALAAFAGASLTPMAAVAGSVAEEICGTIAAISGVRRAYVNNGGDVALHLPAGEQITVGIMTSLRGSSPPRAVRLEGSSSMRGVATSGWDGRSFSLGIADAVTVLAASAAIADAAATVVANSVDLPGNPAVSRVPASSIDAASDLGQRPVTVDVGPLSTEEIDEALGGGVREASRLIDAGIGISGVLLALRGAQRVVGDDLTRLLGPDTHEELAHVR